jgi:2-oxoglutarate dehydrogenase E2 component (dihydrolipoamide succinyltransferase)
VVDVTMPQLGESVETGTITRWLKKSGDPIAVDEPLFEVSSDKVTMEVPSLVAGVVGELVAREGEEVKAGAVVARIATAQQRETVAAAAGANGRRNGRDALSPVVRRLAREHGIDLAHINGSAAGGRITKKDVLGYLASRAPVGVPAPAPASAAGGRTEQLSPMRRTIVARLGAAQKSAVNVFSVVEIDMEAVAAERARRGLTYLPFVARAVVDALRAYPALNASLGEDAASITYHDAVHLGIAVDLDERGLVVPVIRDAQTLTVDGLARAIASAGDGARGGTLPPEAYTGSTFSITNNGAFGALMTAPVINAPNVAIVSTDAVEERPVVIDHMIAIRRRMYFCMTWDHRAFDGSTAARFLAHVKRALETWDWTTH